MYYRYLNRFILASAVTIVLGACGGTTVKPSPAQEPQATPAPEPMRRKHWRLINYNATAPERSR